MMADNNNHILWAERDIGEKFSIVMFAICGVAISTFLAVEGFKNALEGDWLLAFLAAGCVLNMVSVFLNWRRDYAG